MTETSRWLDQRTPPMPWELRRAVDAALEAAELGGAEVRAEAGAEAGAESVADRLADAGLATLARVVRASQDRSTAAELLAADALLTYACEAAAEAGPETLERLIVRLDLTAFAELLEPSGP